jgi:hypothetical protein
MAYADDIRTTDYTREELANLIDGNRFVGEAVTTAGTAPNYTVTLTPAPTAYVDGMSFCIQIHSTLNVSGATLNVNGLGAKDLKITTIGATTRDPTFAELSSRNTYLVAYSSVLDAFTIANPTFGNEINFTPTWGAVSGAGTVGLVSNADTNYRWLGGRTIMVRTWCTLSISGAVVSGVGLALPFNCDSDDRNIVGSAYIQNLSGYSEFYVLAVINQSTNTLNFLLNTGANMPIDTGFSVFGNVIYNVA